MDVVRPRREEQQLARLRECCDVFLDALQDSSKKARREGRNLPTEAELHSAVRTFWQVDLEVQQLLSGGDSKELVYSTVRSLLGPTLFRNRFFWRSYFKPQGYAGDFRLIDDTYALEKGVGQNPFQSMSCNCLDAIIASMDSVVSLWERRHWIANNIRISALRGAEISVLDVACGSARYIGDFQSSEPRLAERASFTCYDQDPAALSFASKDSRANFICGPIKDVFQNLLGRRFDLIVASGIFDYLDDETARRFIVGLSDLLPANGRFLMTNFTPEDRSSVAKEWSGDWSLILRTEEQVRALFESTWSVKSHHSSNRSLLYIEAQK